MEMKTAERTIIIAPSVSTSMVIVLLVLREKVSRLNILTLRFGSMTSFMRVEFVYGLVGWRSFWRHRLNVFWWGVDGVCVTVFAPTCSVSYWARRLVFYDLVLDRNDTLRRVGKIRECFSTHVEIEAWGEWTSVIYPDDDGLIVPKVRNLEFCSKRERFICSRVLVHTVLFAV